MEFLKKRVFTGQDCPKLTSSLYVICGLFKDALFQFNSLFTLLYVQLASPISKNPSFTTMFFIITMCLIGSKILAGFFWSVASHFQENGKFRYGAHRTTTFIGALLSTVFSILTFFVAPLFGDGWSYVIAFLVFYTASECIFSINDTGYCSYANQISLNEKTRGRIVGLANAMGSLGSFSVAALAPAISAGNAKQNMSIILIVITTFYFITQTLYCIFMMERATPEHIRMEKKEKTKLSEPLRILFSDTQVFLAVLAFFFLFISQFTLIGNLSSYLYYEFGYGGFGASGKNGGFFSGGVVSFFFSVCYGIGCTISNIVYARVVAKFGKKKTLIASGIVMILSYVFLYTLGLRRGYEIFLFLDVLIHSFFQGFIFLALTMNVYSSAEWYELKTGKQRAASINAAKALAVKVANGAQTGLFYLFLAISPNLLNLNAKVAEFESLNNRGQLAGNIIDEVNNYIGGIPNLESSLSIYRISITFVPMLFILLAVIITVLFVKVNDEKTYASYVQQIQEKRKEPEREEIE